MLGEDTNLDGKLDAGDATWKELKVWVDANHDGKTDAGELKSLDEAGVASLDLHATKSGAVDNGNLVGPGVELHDDRRQAASDGRRLVCQGRAAAEV